MSTIRISAPVAALTVFILFAPTLAQAQDSRFRVSFAPAVAAVGGNAELALGGSFGYRFSEHFWFDGDFSWLDAGAGGFRDRNFQFGGPITIASNFADNIRRQAGMLAGGLPGGIGGRPGQPNFPTLPIDIGQLQLGASADGSTMIAMMGTRYELPVQTARFRPYVAGGLGINNTDQRFRLDATRLTPAIDQSVSHTGYAFNAGAGASVRVAGPFWADVDARYLRLSRDRNVMQMGGGVSFRF